MRVLGFLRHLGEYGLSPISYYRVGLPLQALRELAGHQADALNQLGLYNRFYHTIQEGKDLSEALEGYDIYVLGRLYREGGTEEYINQVHERGAKVVFDTDDDLSEEFRDIDGKGQAFIRALGLADLVTVSTPYLAKRLAVYTKREPVVLPNHIDTGWFGKLSLVKEKDHSGLNIGVIGTTTHYRDWQCLADPLTRIAEEYEHVNIIAAGFQPDYLEGIYLKPVPYAEYPGMVRELDIICCALDPGDEFNMSKSAIKALEAMSAARSVNGGIGGAVAVCTDMPVYRRVVDHMHNGLLVDNGDWYEALSMLVENEQTRNRIACCGHRWVRDNRDIRHGYRMWERAYLDLLEE